MYYIYFLIIFILFFLAYFFIYVFEIVLNVDPYKWQTYNSYCSIFETRLQREVARELTATGDTDIHLIFFSTLDSDLKDREGCVGVKWEAI